MRSGMVFPQIMVSVALYGGGDLGRIALGHGFARLAKQENLLYMGNLDSKRDWGFAPEYVEAMWMMLQREEPDDYVIGTGETRSVREFLEEAFPYVGL